MLTFSSGQSQYNRRRAGAWHAALVQSVYEAAGGEEAVLALAHAWHARVRADEVVSHTFSHGYHPEHTERLAAYWMEALGGPAKYSERLGDETTVVRMHSGNGPHDEMDRRAIAASISRSPTPVWIVTNGSARSSTTTSAGRRRAPWRATTTPPTTCQKA